MEAKTTKPSNIRNRVKSLRWVLASELKSHARNWRRHPDAQRNALEGVLKEIGFAGAVLARENKGKLELIDGHLRAEMLRDKKAKVPVLILDLTAAEAKKLLLTYDPIGAMAEADSSMLDSLLAESALPVDALRDRLTALTGDWHSVENLGEAPESVHENALELEQMKALRRKGNENKQNKDDTERYLVMVFPSRLAREQVVTALGLPADERYIPALDYEIRRLHRSTEEMPKAAPRANSGATG